MWEPKPFNEKNPYGKDAFSVEGDNIAKSAERYRAMKAMKQGTATAEQIILVQECDRLINDIIENRGR